jgi:hypothetical protein
MQAGLVAHGHAVPVRARSPRCRESSGQPQARPLRLNSCRRDNRSLRPTGVGAIARKIPTGAPLTGLRVRGSMKAALEKEVVQQHG